MLLIVFVSASSQCQLKDVVPLMQTFYGTLISADASASLPQSSAVLVLDGVKIFVDARYNAISPRRQTQLVLLVFVLMLNHLLLVVQIDYGMILDADATVLLPQQLVQLASSGAMSYVLVDVILKRDADGRRC
jgi:hypothetical protein